LKRRLGVDLIALVLAVSLGIAIVMIMVSAIINVVDHQAPTPTLGENTTQVLTSAMGGVVGILGAYVGYAFRRRHDEED
jgi:hypothetical protein